MTWQRIQTLYLGIATALIAAMFFCRFATIIGPDGAEEFIRYYEKMPFLVLLIMLTSAHVAAIGCYKAFFLQARVCIIAGLLAIGFQIWLGIDFLRMKEEMVFNITGVFPVACAILDILAARAALIDEMTLSAVKSARKMKRKKKAGKQEFFLLQEEADNFMYSDFLNVSGIRDELNRICGKDHIKKVFAMRLLELLLADEIIEEIEVGGKLEKVPTEKGKQSGVKVIDKVSAKGYAYSLLMYPRSIQQMLVEKFVREMIDE